MAVHKWEDIEAEALTPEQRARVDARVAAELSKDAARPGEPEDFSAKADRVGLRVIRGLLDLPRGHCLRCRVELAGPAEYDFDWGSLKTTVCRHCMWARLQDAHDDIAQGRGLRVWPFEAGRRRDG